MNLRGIRLASIRKAAACALVIGLSYQLGACPCGCLEHNAWLQMMGLDHDQHDDSEGHDAQHGSLSLQSESHDDHDCDGGPRDPFLDNSRPSQVTSLNSLRESYDTLFQGGLSPSLSLDNRIRRCESIGLSPIPQPDRAALQVFRL